jgi:damage-control phosphatase, subfamily I
MISNYRCFFCFTKAFEKLIDQENLSLEDKNAFTRDMACSYSDFGENFSAPLWSRELHRILRKYSNNPDPYKKIKKESNDIALSMYEKLQSRIASSGDPFDHALRLAIAGNIIDFAIGANFDLTGTIDKVLNTGFAIDHSNELKEEIDKAKTILYLGDNAGEIVFDKLFIKQIDHPNLFYAVRGAPVINDATLEDAKYIEMESVVKKLIANGYDAPSTIVEKSSPEFQHLFDQADLIISKGQGNLEGLAQKTKKNVFFLLMVKCEVIADFLGVQKGDFVVVKNQSLS